MKGLLKCRKLSQICVFNFKGFKGQFLDRRTSWTSSNDTSRTFHISRQPARFPSSKQQTPLRKREKMMKTRFATKTAKNVNPHLLLIKSIPLGDTRRNYRALHNESVGPSKEALSIRFCVAVWILSQKTAREAMILNPAHIWCKEIRCYKMVP